MSLKINKSFDTLIAFKTDGTKLIRRAGNTDIDTVDTYYLVLSNGKIPQVNYSRDEAISEFKKYFKRVKVVTKVQRESRIIVQNMCSEFEQIMYAPDVSKTIDSIDVEYSSDEIVRHDISNTIIIW